MSSLFLVLLRRLSFVFFYIFLTRAQSSGDEADPFPLPVPIRLLQPRARFQPNPLADWNQPADQNPAIDQEIRNPRAQIRCIGRPFRSRALPIAPANLMYAQITQPSRQLCAKPEYGGNPDFNLGGYCRYDIPGAHRSPLVVFDQESLTVDNAVVEASVPKLALYNYCQFQCRCVRDPLRHVENFVIPAQEIVEFERSDPPVWDLNPITTTDVIGESTHRPYTEQLFLVMAENSRVWEENSWGALSFTADSLYRSPRCRNVMPTWSLPPPFENLPPGWQLIDLCASVFSGGSRKGNAGGACLISNGNQAEITFEGYLSQ
jgi:hypothetical protein